ncbi:MAG: histone deacetylase [Chloroherpetonaceae bacterium]|nr:histone deacetylase [Chloroherpetonaceae bacterium]MDW8436831.1 histone deacetylase [Chloroherpetonaceae bacterium]
MKVFYSDHYTIPLPDGHRFPMEKYRLIRLALLRDGVLRDDELAEPPMPSAETLTLAHAPDYVQAVTNGTLTEFQIRKIGFPYSAALVRRSYATVGGALAAAEEALRNGISGNLAGGTHHAFADSGEGYCVFNDLAVVTNHLISVQKVKRVAIIDLDVHQGNGNAAILGGRSDVFIFSMHGAKNYPFRKVPSTLDIDLPDGTGDKDFLAILKDCLPKVFAFKPDIVLYQAGVDPLKEDALGRLALTLEGLQERDRLVLKACRKHGIPVSLALGGGYAQPIDLTVEAHVGTYKAVRETF